MKRNLVWFLILGVLASCSAFAADYRACQRFLDQKIGYQCANPFDHPYSSATISTLFTIGEDGSIQRTPRATGVAKAAKFASLDGLVPKAWKVAKFDPDFLEYECDRTGEEGVRLQELEKSAKWVSKYALKAGHETVRFVRNDDKTIKAIEYETGSSKQVFNFRIAHNECFIDRVIKTTSWGSYVDFNLNTCSASTAFRNAKPNISDCYRVNALNKEPSPALEKELMGRSVLLSVVTERYADEPSKSDVALATRCASKEAASAVKEFAHGFGISETHSTLETTFLVAHVMNNCFMDRSYSAQIRRYRELNSALSHGAGVPGKARATQ